MKNFLTAIFRRSSYPSSKYNLKLAFTSGGIDYYQFSDFNNMPALRGLKTMVFYEEIRMKCTSEFLRLHTEAIDNLITPKPGKGISIKEIGRLNDQLKQRLDMALDTELLYKIASVVFFDKKENIEDYDFDYNERKIDHWKKNNGTDFFLQQPLMELLPVLKDFDGNFLQYSQVVEKLNNLHLESLLQNLPDERTAKLNGKSYLSLIMTPQK